MHVPYPPAMQAERREERDIDPAKASASGEI
jgi:hypothetical protein